MPQSEQGRGKTTSEHQIEIERFIANVATQFINLEIDQIDREISNAVKTLGEFTGADRSYIILFSKDNVQIEKVYGWRAAGIEPGVDILEGIFLEETGWAFEEPGNQNTSNLPTATILLPRVSPDKSQPAERRQAVITVPLAQEDIAIGVLGLEAARVEKDWSESNTELLKRMSQIFMGTLERKWREEKQRSNGELYREIVSSITDHIYVTEVTEDGQRLNLYISHHAKDLTDYSAEILMSDWSLWPETIIHPNDRGIAAAQAAQLSRGEDSEMEYRLIRADGTVIWVRDRARVKNKGESKIVYGLVSNITQRKITELEREWLTNELRDVQQTLEERVAARTAELKAILDAVGEGIVVTDLDGTIQYLNPALERLTGYSEAEALGQTPSLWKSDRHDNAFFDQMWQTILGGQTWRGETVNRSKNGRLYEVALTISPIQGTDGHTLGFVGVQHDITPLKEMDRMKTEFISTAAHELRTPLTSIQGFSEILSTRELSDERKARYITYINQQAEALAAIIDDLLDLSRLEAGEGFEIAEKLVDIKQVVEDVTFGFQENHPEYDYRIIGPEEWPSIKGDEAKLSQLIKNLVSNATKYSPEGSQILFEAVVEPRYRLLHLTLTDQGVGMTPEQLAQVFDRFYRADASNTAIGGTGLGMTISRLIVERHGGRVWVESEYGAGTVVHVMLPFPERLAHILVIEDDRVLQEIQRRHLEIQGFAVLTAEEGELGLELANTCLIDLILLDLALPGMTGFDVLERLHANEITKNIPVIITSAMDKPEEVEKTLSNVVIDYLVKPYTMNDLSVRINRGLGKTRLERGGKWYM